MQSTTSYINNPHSKPSAGKWWRRFRDKRCTQCSWGALLFFIFYLYSSSSLGNPLPCVSLGVLPPPWPSYTPPILSRSQPLSSRMLSILHQCPFQTPQPFPNQKGKKNNIFSKQRWKSLRNHLEHGRSPMPSCIPAWGTPLPHSPASSSTRSARQPTNSLYLGTVLTLVVLPAVVWHLVTYQVGLPVESFGALVTLVLPLLAVWQHVLLQAVETGTGLSEVWVYRKRREQRT